MRHVLQWLAVIVIAAAISGCTSAPPKKTEPPGKTGGWTGYTETGKASFYANTHENKKTANGERYHQALKTAAHRTIPFGSKINVTNIANGKSVVATVNDRGPYVKSRIVDLSKSAFSSIASTSSGVINVQLEVID